MRFLFIVILLVLIGAGLFWFRTPQTELQPNSGVEEKIIKGAEQLKEAIAEKLSHLSLEPDDIKEEIDRTGKVVRRKAKEISGALAEAAADTSITARIKTKFVADSDLSALSISVNTTDGVVTLSGSVSEHEHIGKAMLLALETEGVREVISTLQVRRVKSEEEP